MNLIVRFLLRFRYDISVKVLDKSCIEMLGRYGILYTFRKRAQQVRKLQSAFVYHYAFMMLTGWQSFVEFIYDCVLNFVNEQI